MIKEYIFFWFSDAGVMLILIVVYGHDKDVAFYGSLIFSIILILLCSYRFIKLKEKYLLNKGILK